MSFWKNLKISKKTFFLFLLLSLLQGSLSFFSGVRTNKGVVFQSVIFHDSIWHLALIEHLKRGYPFSNPNLSGSPLRGYNYFYDYLLMVLIKIFPILPFDLYFRIMPFLLSFLLAVSFYFFVWELFNNEKIALWSVFFLFLTGSFGFFLGIFGKESWGESSFWVSQTFSMTTNQQFLFSLSIFFIICLLFLRYLKNGKKKLILIAGFLIILLVGIKTYGAILALIGFLFFSLYLFYQKKEIFCFLIFCFLLPFIFLVSKFLIRGVSFPFFLKPGWFLNSMVESADRVDLVRLTLKEQDFLFHKNYLGFALIKFLETLMFFIGNLGVRTIGFLGILLVLINKKKKDRLFAIHISLFSMALFASFFPLFFLQKGVVWNSIQFWYYFLPIMVIYESFAFVFLLSKLKGVKKFFIILIFISLSLPTTVRHFIYEMNKKRLILVPNELLEALRVIKENTAENEVIVVPPDGIIQLNSLVSFFAQRQVFLADQGTLEIMQIDYKERLAVLEELFKNKRFEAIFELKKIEPEAKYLLKTENDSLSDIMIEVKKDEIPPVLSIKRDFQIGEWEVIPLEKISYEKP